MVEEGSLQKDFVKQLLQGVESFGDSDALQTALSRLDDKLDAVKGRIHDEIRSNGKRFGTVFTRVNGLAADMAHMHGEWDALMRNVAGAGDGASDEDAVGDPAAIAQIRHVHDRAHALREQLEAQEEHVAVLASVAAVVRHVRLAHTAVLASEHATAAQHCNEAARAMDELQREHPALYDVAPMVALRASFATCNDTVRDAVCTAWERMWAVDHDAGEVTLHSEPAHVLDALAAAQQLGVADSAVHHIHASLVAVLVRPLCTRADAQLSVKVDTLRGVRELSCMYDASLAPTPPTPLDVLPRLRAVFAEVALWLGSEREWMGAVGSAAWDAVAHLVIRNSLHASIPINSKGIDAYGDVAHAARAFDAAMAADGWLPHGERMLRFTHFVDNVEQHYLEKKRSAVLARARKLLQDRQYRTVRVPKDAAPKEAAPQGDQAEAQPRDAAAPVDDGPFAFPPCTVTQVCARLVSAIQKVLGEAVDAPPACAPDLVRLVVDMVDLYVVTFAAFHEPALGDIPQLCMLFHNDCMFLAHSLLPIPHMYANRWAPGASAAADVVRALLTAVPRLRASGGAYLHRGVSRQLRRVHGLLNALPRWSAVGDDETFDALKSGVAGILRAWKAVSKLWKDVLPHDLYLQCMALLVEPVTLAATAGVVAMGDIGVEEGERLHLLLAQLRGVRNAFAGGSVAQYVAAWDRFSQVCDLLTFNLAQIRERWDAGALAVLHAKELVHLIKALFEDSPKRKAMLTTIVEATRRR